MFSVGILYSAQEFIEFLKTTPDLNLDFPNTFRNFGVASTQAMLDLVLACRWVTINCSGNLMLTEKGQQILDCKQPDLALRTQIGHLIETFLPTWLPLLSRGRLETEKYLPPNVLQCFEEAGLFSEITIDLVNWWDRYSKVSRRISKDKKLDIGRTGEQLSLQYEIDRTNRMPRWQGFETNLAGYDILSVIDTTDHRNLLIEVKTANASPSNANIYITRNEWNVATVSEHYVFHLWSLQPKPKLTIINTSQLAYHIPFDNGDGLWEKVLVPFSAFIS